MEKSRIHALVVLCLVIIVFTLLGCNNDDGNESVDGDSENSELDSDIDSFVDGDTDVEMEEEAEAQTTVLKVMTYNILCYFCDSSYDDWDDRIGYIADTFDRYDPDLFGTQELFANEDLSELVEANPEYDAFYYIDDGTGIFSEYPDATIFYKRDRFEIVESGVYWLSNQPDTPWTGFNSSVEEKKMKASAFWRLVAWAVFNDKNTNKQFYFSTTHYDNNVPHQAQSAPISLEYIEPYAEKMPVIFVGDFNSTPDTEAYSILTKGVDGEGFSLQNTFDLAENWSSASNEDPAPEYDPDRRIDHIFVAGQAEWEVKEWIVDMYVYGENSMPPSDHYAMFTELHFK